MTYDDWKTTDPRDADPNDAPFLTPCKHCGSLECDGSCESETERDIAIRQAQELADFMGESRTVWENAHGMFRNLPADTWPDGREWALIETVRPR